MTSKIKVDNINKVSDDSNIIKKCGTTTTIGSGASNPIVVDGSAITLGRCGGTVALASGATQTGFGRTGTVDWQTTPKTATFTAVSGEGYFANTSGGTAFNMNLPAGVAGAIVSVADYAATFQTTNLTVVPNGTDKIGGVNTSVILNTEGQSITFVFVDSTQGWINTMDSTSNVRGNANLVATGGTITTSGNCKIHTFTGPGDFTVTNTAACAANNVVSYMVVAGGASGGKGNAGGGGAGGFREVKSPVTPYTASPLDGYSTPANRVTVSTQAYPITVGGGGTAQPTPYNPGNVGSNSIFSTIISAGGGVGGSYSNDGGAGGSGGGAGADNNSGGAGNTPPTTPAQGQNGANTTGPICGASGGGGAGGAGNSPSPAQQGGAGGAGVTTQINASPVQRAGGGGGWGRPGPGGAGGAGGGGAGASEPGGAAGCGTANTGGGGGGKGNPSPSGGAGGSGIVIIRYKFQ